MFRSGTRNDTGIDLNAVKIKNLHTEIFPFLFCHWLNEEANLSCHTYEHWERFVDMENQSLILKRNKERIEFEVLPNWCTLHYQPCWKEATKFLSRALFFNGYFGISLRISFESMFTLEFIPSFAPCPLHLISIWSTTTLLHVFSI